MGEGCKSEGWRVQTEARGEGMRGWVMARYSLGSGDQGPTVGQTKGNPAIGGGRRREGGGTRRISVPVVASVVSSASFPLVSTLEPQLILLGHALVQLLLFRRQDCLHPHLHKEGEQP